MGKIKYVDSDELYDMDYAFGSVLVAKNEFVDTVTKKRGKPEQFHLCWYDSGIKNNVRHFKRFHLRKCPFEPNDYLHFDDSIVPKLSTRPDGSQFFSVTQKIDGIKCSFSDMPFKGGYTEHVFMRLITAPFLQWENAKHNIQVDQSFVKIIDELFDWKVPEDYKIM
jgi:hypothetical protein